MSWEKFDSDLKEIIDSCSVEKGHAGCYLCNFEDEYICYEYNGGCKKLNQCRDIREKLQQNVVYEFKNGSSIKIINNNPEDTFRGKRAKIIMQDDDNITKELIDEVLTPFRDL